MPMKRKTIWKWPYMGLLSAILLIGTGFLMLGTAYGRYQKTKTWDIPFVVREHATFQVIFGEGWTTQDESDYFAFSVGNRGNSGDTYFTLRLATTIGVSYDKAKVSLIVKNTSGARKVYEGVAAEVDETSTLYQEMGAGSEYIFYNAEGEELSWKLEGAGEGETLAQEFVLEIQGANEPNLMEIIVTETQKMEK